MRRNGKFGNVVLCGLVLAVLANTARNGHAQEPPRWKFEPGQKLNYNMVQEMAMSTAGTFGEQSVTMNQEMEMTWQVAEINQQGDAVIHQKFDRMKMKMTLPPALGGVIEYDSQSDKPPVGPAAAFAPMYKALMQAQFELTMTPRGEITDVKVPDEVITALQNSPGGMAMGDLASPEGFKKMISNGALVLPETTPQPGEQWSNKVELTMPGTGKQIVETTYRFAGIKEVDGISYAAFSPSLEMQISPEIITVEGNDTKTSPGFALGRGGAKIRYSFQNDTGDDGTLSVYIIEEGKDFDQASAKPVVTSQAAVESESTIQKPPGKYYLQIVGAGNWKVTVENMQPMKVTDQASSGEILFNLEAGRLHSSALDQKVTMTHPGGVQSTIDQSIMVKVTPADGAEPASEN
jgi:hypothetical protein